LCLEVGRACGAKERRGKRLPIRGTILSRLQHGLRSRPVCFPLREEEADWFMVQKKDFGLRKGPEKAVLIAFVRRLVEDYGYPPECIQTDPPYRTPAAPSGGSEYPLDISVFRSVDARTLDDLFMVVETKAPSKEEGERQIKTYLALCPAQVGVWYNGEDHAYWRKVVTSAGIQISPIADIPRYGQRVDDIGKFRRKDLKVPSNLKAIFQEIRNHLAGHTRNITRDQEFANNIIHVLFCKIYDELHTPPDCDVEFRAGVEEDAKVIAARIHRLFEERVKVAYADIFKADDRIELDEESLAYVVGSLQGYALTDPAVPRDAIGEAFEVFIGPALRGEEGQFFTPRNVVRMMISLLKPRPEEALIDPACGSGGFLVEALRELWAFLEDEQRKFGWSVEHLERKKVEVANRCLRGIDKDRFLVKVARAYMALLGNGRESIFCENSLDSPSGWSVSTRAKVSLGKFHIVVTNPPHGSRVRVKGLSVTGQYDLAKRWRLDKEFGVWVPGVVRENVAVPILFLERCYQLLAEGGRLGIVFPETYLGMPEYRYVSAWLLRNMRVRAVIAMPEDLFQPYTHNKTCVILAERALPTEDDLIVMASVRWCGHDSRGRPIPRDDVAAVGELVGWLLEKGDSAPLEKLLAVGDSWAFVLPRAKLHDYILVPKYYDPRLREEAERLSGRFELVSLGELVKRGWVSVRTGVEVGKLAYGTGEIPFVRTSDLSTWEIKIDPKQGVSEDIYEKYAGQASVAPGDVLMVRDGTYLVGTVALVTSYDPQKILIPSGMLCFRVTERGERNGWNPYLLLALLSSPFVRRQIRSKQFTRGVIDTLGDRYRELLLPLPKDPAERVRLVRETRSIVEMRAKLKERISVVLRKLASVSEGPLLSDEEG